MGCFSANNNIIALPLLLVAIITQNKHKAPTDDDSSKCELFGTFSLITQGILGFLCISSLIAKRFYEFPIRRPWLVWFFDVSKQLIGAFGVHVFNVMLSLAPKNDDDLKPIVPPPDEIIDDDPCDWYFLNIMLDCTIGVCILYFIFKYVNLFCKKYLKLTNIESGNYGDQTPSIKAYLKQLAIYSVSLIITKLSLYLLVKCFEQELLWITHNIILIWFVPYPPEFEIFIVMFVVPIVMNILQLILIDNFIQNQSTLNINQRLFGESDSVVAKETQGLRNRVHRENDYGAAGSS